MSLCTAPLRACTGARPTLLFGAPRPTPPPSGRDQRGRQPERPADRHKRRRRDAQLVRLRARGERAGRTLVKEAAAAAGGPAGSACLQRVWPPLVRPLEPRRPAARLVRCPCAAPRSGALARAAQHASACRTRCPGPAAPKPRGSRRGAKRCQRDCAGKHHSVRGRGFKVPRRQDLHAQLGGERPRGVHASHVA